MFSPGIGFSAGGDFLRNRKTVPWYWILLGLGLTGGACLANLSAAAGGGQILLWGETAAEKYRAILLEPAAAFWKLAPLRLGGFLLLLLSGRTIFGKLVNGGSVFLTGLGLGCCLGLLAQAAGIAAPACFLCLACPQYLCYLPAGWLLWAAAGSLRPEKRGPVLLGRGWKMGIAAALTAAGTAAEVWLNPVLTLWALEMIPY